MKALDYAGYAKLRLGRIHLYCPCCKRKHSNMPRSADPEDPKRAVLAHIVCNKCGIGSKDSDISYLDRYGQPICGLCGGYCEYVTNTSRRCSNRLVNESVKRGARLDRERLDGIARGEE